MRFQSGKRLVAAVAGAVMLVLGAGVGLAAAEPGDVADDHRQDASTPAADAPGLQPDGGAAGTPAVADPDPAAAAAASSSTSSDQVCDGDPSGQSDDGSGANTG